MKTAEASTSRHGDVSPISLAEGTPKGRKGEPSSEKLSNFSRVVPAQLAYITFPPDSRYKPVRVISTRPPPGPKAPKTASAVALAAERYAGGGGILILADSRPDEEADYVEFETAPAAPAAAAAPAQSAGSTTAGRHIALDESAPEADPPESFEVCPAVLPWRLPMLTDMLYSTRSIMIRRGNVVYSYSGLYTISLAIEDERVMFHQGRQLDGSVSGK